MKYVICEKCGREFDALAAESEFEEEVNCGLLVSYHGLEGHLCGACAVEEFKKGNYFETCQSCGKRFYPVAEQRRFQKQISHQSSSAYMYEFGIHCADCAAEKLQNSLEDPDSLHS